MNEFGKENDKDYTDVNSLYSEIKKEVDINANGMIDPSELKEFIEKTKKIKEVKLRRELRRKALKESFRNAPAQTVATIVGMTIWAGIMYIIYTFM